MVPKSDDTFGINAIFLARFDPKKAHILDFFYPESSKYQDLEYGSLPSRVQERDSDIVIIQPKNTDEYCICAYARLESNDEHRGYRMISFGIVIDSSVLYNLKFLSLISKLRFYASSLTNSDFDFNKHEILESIRQESFESLLDNIDPYTVSFVKALDYNISEVYRAALLRKRILIVGPPEVYELCIWTLIIQQMSTFQVTDETASEPLFALFSIGLRDIDRLRSLSSYVACTTDAILAENKALYDVLLVVQRYDAPRANVKITDEKLASNKSIKLASKQLKRLIASKWNQNTQNDNPNTLYKELIRMSGENNTKLIHLSKHLSREYELESTPECLSFEQQIFLKEIVNGKEDSKFLNLFALKHQNKGINDEHLKSDYNLFRSAALIAASISIVIWVVYRYYSLK